MTTPLLLFFSRLKQRWLGPSQPKTCRHRWNSFCPFAFAILVFFFCNIFSFSLESSSLLDILSKAVVQQCLRSHKQYLECIRDFQSPKTIPCEFVNAVSESIFKVNMKIVVEFQPRSTPRALFWTWILLRKREKQITKRRKHVLNVLVRNQILVFVWWICHSCSLENYDCSRKLYHIDPKQMPSLCRLAVRPTSLRIYLHQFQIQVQWLQHHGTEQLL